MSKKYFFVKILIFLLFLNRHSVDYNCKINHSVFIYFIYLFFILFHLIFYINFYIFFIFIFILFFIFILKPLHFDMVHNFFTQIRGKKRWIIVDPKHYYDCYPFTRNHPSARQSQVKKIKKIKKQKNKKKKFYLLTGGY